MLLGIFLPISLKPLRTRKYILIWTIQHSNQGFNRPKTGQKWPKMAKISIFLKLIVVFRNLFANLTQTTQNKEIYTHLNHSTLIPGLLQAKNRPKTGQKLATVRRIKNRTVCICSILLSKSGLFKPNTDEFIAQVFVVDGSTFGLDDKLHRLWRQS